MSIDIVILAAGQGTRMQSAQPKVLHKLAGKPLLEHVLSTARTLPDCRLHVVIGYEGDQVKQVCDSQDIQWIVQDKQLGTGHAVSQTLSYLHSDLTLILYGDVPCISQATLESLLRLANSKTLALLTAEYVDPTGYGRIIRDKKNKVCAIVEHKDATDQQKLIKEINTGILVAPTASLKAWLPALDNKNAQQEYYLTDIIAMAIDDDVTIVTLQPSCNKEILGVNDRIQLSVLERWLQIEYAEQLMLAGATLMDPQRVNIRGCVKVEQDVMIDANVLLVGEVNLGHRTYVGPNCIIINSTIGDDVVIAANCVIENTIISNQCIIGPFARLRPGTELEEAVKIGNFVETKKSIIGKGSKINHLSYVGDAIIEEQVNIGAGTITCNYDGVNKHQTIIKNGAFVGSNTSIIAPITIEKNATIGAGSTVTKDVGADELAITRAKQQNIKDWKRPTKQKK